MSESNHRAGFAMDVTVTGEQVLKEWLQNFSLRADFHRTAVERAMLSPGEPLIVEPSSGLLRTATQGEAGHIIGVAAGPARAGTIVGVDLGREDGPINHGWQEVTGSISFVAGKPWTEADVAMILNYGTAAPNDSVQVQPGTATHVPATQGFKMTYVPQWNVWPSPQVDPADALWQQPLIETVEAIQAFGTWEEMEFPHEDTRVLHGPGRCSECDTFPGLQAARMRWGIAFTDDPVRGGEMPCPSSKGWRWLAKVFARRVVAKAIRLVVDSSERAGRAITFRDDA